jgi:hypothetical protein
MLHEVLRKVYRDGPAYMGGWLGLSDVEVCAKLAPGSQALDWVRHGQAEFTTSALASGRCLDMIDRGFQGFAMTVYTVLAMFVLHVVYRAAQAAIVSACTRFRGAQQIPQGRGQPVVGYGAQDFHCLCKCPVHRVHFRHGSVRHSQGWHHACSDDDVHNGTQGQQSYQQCPGDGKDPGFPGSRLPPLSPCEGLPCT